MNYLSILFKSKYFIVSLLTVTALSLIYYYRVSIYGGLDSFDFFIILLGLTLISSIFFVKKKENLNFIILISIITLLTSLLLKNLFISCNNLSPEQKCICSFLEYKSKSDNLKLKENFQKSCKNYPNFNKDLT